MEVKFEDYLSEDERKEIVADVFRNMCINSFKKDAERIFSNAAYNAVFNIVNDTFDGKAAQMVAERTQKIIRELSPYTVFKRKDYWEKEDSHGYQVLNEAISNNKELLNNKIAEIIDEIDKGDLRQTIIEQAQEVISVKLFGKAA